MANAATPVRMNGPALFKTEGFPAVFIIASSCQ
jgi:hypothetical protein